MSQPPRATPPSANRLDFGRFQGRVIASQELPPRPARLVNHPAGLHPDLQAALHALGLPTLYSHQAETFDRARAGENVVLTTGTASGKSLAYLLPVLQQVLEDPSRRALLFFPTKALAQDQLRGLLRVLRELGEQRVEAGVYDGDTPPAERTRIREKANLILTNPDMLNAGLLPNHGRKGYSHLFRNVRFLVLDELHSYRGAFGAHVANLLRRLYRICRHHGSEPQVLASSATIANPRELAETLCGRPFSLIEEDGAPSAGRVIHFWLPPATEQGLRRGVVQELAQLVPHLVSRRYRFIAFCRSRKETEIVLRESRDRLRDVDGGHDESNLVAGYRGGYTPEERRTVERALVAGELLGVVSTNALELGVDIGSLEVAAQAGFPGTRASFWQQIGRAGRRDRQAHAILILGQRPEDQYIGLDPEWLLSRRAEHAVVDPDNLLIELAHVRAAAAELPLELDDCTRFPDLAEMIPILLEAGELAEEYGAYHWRGGPYPAGDFSLRNLDRDRYKIVNRVTGTTITEMDRPQTYEEAYPRAIYLHDGVEYLVETLDHVGRVATVIPVEQNYYTEPHVKTKIDVLLVQQSRPMGEIHGFFGDVRVDRTVVGYKMLQFHNHQNLGYEMLTPPLTTQVETEALWLPLPDHVQARLAAEEQDVIPGLVHAVLACARMRTMAERTDLCGASFHQADPQTGRVANALILHDSHPGGLGFAARAYDELPAILRAAVTLVDRCPCRDGCPACVGDERIDRRVVAWGLHSLLEAQPPLPGPGLQPPGSPTEIPPVLPPLAIPWPEVPGRWGEVTARLRTDPRRGAALLASVPEVHVVGRRLELQVTRPGLTRWLELPATQARLGELLGSHLQLPPETTLTGRVDPAAQEQATARTIKLRRRHDDLTKPGT